MPGAGDPIPPAVADKLASYSQPQRKRIESVRKMIFDQALSLESCGEVRECLKWGQISYLTEKPKSGTTIRIDVNQEGHVALFVHCQSRLVDEIREMYPGEFELKGNREIVLDNDKPLSEKTLGHCISMALTYHNRRRSSQ